MVLYTTWITVVILELIHAQKPDFAEGWHLLDTKPTPFFLTRGGWVNGNS